MMFKPILKLAAYALQYRRYWAAILCATVAGSAMTLLQPWPMKVLVDQVLHGRDAAGWIERILDVLPDSRSALLAAVVGAGLVIFAINSVSDVLLTRAWVMFGQGMIYDVARDLYAKLLRRSAAFHTHHRVGDAMARLTGDSWVVHTLVDTLIFAPLVALVMLAAMTVIMLQMDVWLTLLALVVAPFMGCAAWVLGGPVRAIAKARRELDSRFNSHVHQALSAIPVVQAFTQEQREHERFRSLAEDAIRLHRRGAWVSSASDLTSGLITTFGTAAILLIAGQRVLADQLTVGSLLVFLGYLSALQTQMRTLATAYLTLQGARPSIDRLMEIIESQPEVREAPDAIHLDRARGHVTIENVTFGYQPGRAVLRSVSLEARPGEVIALVGATGAGKSTLVSLVPRLFDPWEGSVRIDGTDVREIRLRDLRRQIAVVHQESMLFPTSIADNIAYGREGATREEVEAAARAANVDEFVSRMPEGYQSVIGERGCTLSGGQRQRIAIARAILKNAPVLILDEPTSSLDAGTEALIMEALQRLMRGRTTFIIAHRLSTVRSADRIVVVEDGRIVEFGSHAELMRRGGAGAYARLVQAQIGRAPRAATAAAVVEGVAS